MKYDYVVIIDGERYTIATDMEQGNLPGIASGVKHNSNEYTKATAQEGCDCLIPSELLRHCVLIEVPQAKSNI